MIRGNNVLLHCVFAGAMAMCQRCNNPSRLSCVVVYYQRPFHRSRERISKERDQR